MIRRKGSFLRKERVEEIREGGERLGRLIQGEEESRGGGGRGEEES